MRITLRDYEQKAIDDLTYAQDKVEELRASLDALRFKNVNAHAKKLMELRLAAAEAYQAATDRLVRYQEVIRRNTKEGT